jgi:hypothetical protein
MKKEDMKKRLSGEKIDLKTESNRISFLLLFFFLSSEILPQIPINGFCKLSSYQFSPGQSRLFSLNFNNDSYTDLILYNSSSKKISAIAGEKNEKFLQLKEFDFPFEVSNFSPIREKNIRITKYAFTSRKNLVAGLCEFSAEAKPKITHKLNFKSYPENLSVSDIDNDSQQEILVSGPSFEGMSILKLDGKNLKEIVVIKKNSYSDAVFIDLTNDGFPDISAINLLNSSLEFFFNNGRGTFKAIRSITLNQRSTKLHTFDMNLDGYHDLIFLEGNKIKLRYGDFSSSYSKQITIETKYIPDDFIIGDFNKDGKIDFAYKSTDASIVSVIFAKDDFAFSPEIPIFQRARIEGMISFYSKFINGLAVLCDDGTLLTNTSLASYSTDLDMSLAIEPSTISYFDANTDAINDICLIDRFDKNLKLVVRNNNGVAADYFSIRLRENHNQIKVKNFSKQISTFFCYSHGQKLVEVIEVEFKTGKVNKSVLYAVRPITELEPFQGEHQNIIVSSLSNGRLAVETYEKEESWKAVADYIISEGISNVDLSNFKDLKLFFSKLDEDSIKFFKKTLFPRELRTELVFKVKMGNVSNIKLIADDFFNLEKESIISFVESGEKHYILVSLNGSVNVFETKDVNKNLIVNDLRQLSVGEIRTFGSRRLIVKNDKDQSVYRLNILRKGKKIIFSKMFENISAGAFFVKNMTLKNYHFVYVNNTKRCISIKQI